MTNFVIAPTLTVGIQSTLPGIVIATTWPLNSSLAKLENANTGPHHVYCIQSKDHHSGNLNKILEALDNHSEVFELEEVYL